MAFKVSNETKVGALSAIAITLLILGANFLKGKSLFSKGKYVYVKFKTSDGLLPSNEVFINGLSVGSVYKLEPASANLDSVLVTIKLTQDINIPRNSIAEIKSNPLGSSSIAIEKGTDSIHIKSGEYIISTKKQGILDKLSTNADPLMANLRTASASLDTTLSSINATLNAQSRANITAMLQNFNTVSTNLVRTTQALNSLIASNSATLNSAMANVNTLTKELAANKGKITTSMSNVEKTTENLSKIELDATLNKLNATIATFNETLASINKTMDKVNSGNNSLGALINDKKLYNNITSTTNSLNLLLTDFRLYPKRYLGGLVFGKKDKRDPLMKPLDEDSVTQEQKRDSVLLLNKK
jgi:phospholipid/cholesterol/gamma-HCH transport system substrate-binding protein